MHEGTMQITVICLFFQLSQSAVQYQPLALLMLL